LIVTTFHDVFTPDDRWEGARVTRLHRAKLTGKGQVQVPKAIREVLGADRGDDLVFRVEESGAVYVTCEPKKTLSDLAGILPPSSPRGTRLAEGKDPQPGREEDVAASEAADGTRACPQRRPR